MINTSHYPDLIARAVQTQRPTLLDRLLLSNDPTLAQGALNALSDLIDENARLEKRLGDLEYAVERLQAFGYDLSALSVQVLDTCREVAE